ncbi:MAG TPA: heat-shock protein [Methanophagales archaeon]|nr:heat-shock protein [Methanophagales archaeon]
MSVRAKMKGPEYKRYQRTLILSTALAFLILYIAFGLIFFAKEGNPIPKPFILLILAIYFIIFVVFYESRGKEKSTGKDSLKSLIKGLFLAICATFALVAIIGGVKLMIYYEGFELIGGFGSFISALAICMIVSMTFLSMLRPLSQ